MVMMYLDEPHYRDYRGNICFEKVKSYDELLNLVGLARKPTWLHWDYLVRHLAQETGKVATFPEAELQKPSNIIMVDKSVRPKHIRTLWQQINKEIEESTHP
jgi:hypothetical protein